MALESLASELSVNRVVKSKGVSLDCKPNDIVGPNPISLPLQRDTRKVAFTLEHVLSAQDCEHLMEAAEAEGFGIELGQHKHGFATPRDITGQKVSCTLPGMCVK